MCRLLASVLLSSDIRKANKSTMDTRNSVQERISRCVRLRRNVPPGKRSFKAFTPIAVRIRPPAPGGLPECRRLASRALK